MFDMVDNMTKPPQMMLTGNKGLADSLRATRRELDDMAKTQKRIGEFREMRKGLANTASAFGGTRTRRHARPVAARDPLAVATDDQRLQQGATRGRESGVRAPPGRPRTSHAHPARRRGHRHAQPVADERNLRATMASRASMIDAGGVRHPAPAASRRQARCGSTHARRRRSGRSAARRSRAPARTCSACCPIRSTPRSRPKAKRCACVRRVRRPTR